VRLDDWRNASPDTVAHLLAREQARWQGQLGWDASPSWAIVEAARRDSQLPGLIASDAAPPSRSWTMTRGGSPSSWLVKVIGWP